MVHLLPERVTAVYPSVTSHNSSIHPSTLATMTVPMYVLIALTNAFAQPARLLRASSPSIATSSIALSTTNVSMPTLPLRLHTRRSEMPPGRGFLLPRTRATWQRGRSTMFG